VRGSCRPGDQYPANEGLRFIDQSGKLCVITRAVVREVGGPVIRNVLNIALTWIGLGLRTVITDLEVQCEEKIDIARAKALIVPLAENASTDDDFYDIVQTQGAPTIPRCVIPLSRRNRAATKGSRSAKIKRTDSPLAPAHIAALRSSPPSKPSPPQAPRQPPVWPRPSKRSRNALISRSRSAPADGQ
jgi:hypothetical protein